MIDGLMFVFIGILIGVLIPFIAGWVTFDRSLHELINEAQVLQKESQDLRQLTQTLAAKLQELEGEMADAEKNERVTAVGILEDSISSFSIEREIAGLARGQARYSIGQ